MKIGINCRSFLKKNYTGIGRYAHSLVKALTEIDDDNEYLLYANKGLLNSSRILPEFKKENFKVKRDFFNLGLDRTLGKVDIFHSPSPDIINISRAKIVVTVHDLVYKAFPEGHTEETLKLTDEQIKSFLPNVSKIICPSKNTQSDLHKYFEISEDRTCVIPQGVDTGVFYKLPGEEMELARKFVVENGIGEEFILAVGTIEPRKNLKSVFKSFSLLKEKNRFSGKLVIVGMKGWKSKGILEYVDELGIQDDVIFLGFISNAELRYLYNMTKVFVFPSYYEGFGYPIIEAFSCGAAVVSSNVASCVEVAKDAALLVSPGNCDEIASAITNILGDTELNCQLRKTSSERAKEYSYTKTAQRTLEIYKEVYMS